MTEYERRIVADVMAEAALRRERLAARHRSVVAGVRVVRVESARLAAPKTQTTTPAQQVSVQTSARRRVPRSWDLPDGFEVAVFPPAVTRVYAPPHLFASSDRSWRRSEVP